MATHPHDVDRFNRWARTYDRHWMQRVIFGPVERTVLQLAEEEVPRPTAMVDVGCGTGRLLRSAELRFPNAKLVGVDAAIEMVKRAAASSSAGSAIRFQQAIAEELPFPSSRFDLVFSTLTFHHWQDQSKGIAEVQGCWLLTAAGCSRTSSRPDL